MGGTSLEFQRQALVYTKVAKPADRCFSMQKYEDTCFGPEMAPDKRDLGQEPDLNYSETASISRVYQSIPSFMS